MAVLMMLSLVLTIVNIFLISGLLYIYLRNFKKFKSFLSAGLMLFATLFLLENLVSLYFALTMMALYTPEAEVFACVLRGLQTFAFIILNIITWK